MRILVAVTLLLGLIGSARADRVSVMVLIKEQHLAQRQAPDPAVETAVIRQLIDDGYKVIDPKRIAELREQEALDRILTKGRNWQADVQRIGKKVGADVMVVGEAFTEVAAQRTEQTELGAVQVIRCRGRLEVRAIRTANAEIAFTDSEQGTGPGEPTELLSSKAALEELGVRLVPRLSKKLEGLKGSGAFVTIEVRGVERATDATKIRDAIKRVAGVVAVSDLEFEGRNMIVEVRLAAVTASTLASRLELSSDLKGYKLQTQSISKAKIILNVRAR